MVSRIQTQASAQDIKSAASMPVIVTRRFSMADLEPFGVWLHGRLKDRWVTLTERMFPTFVKDWMGSNEYLFLCTKHAVGLAQVYHEPMDPQPYVREIFVFVKDDHIDDGVPT